MNKEWGPIATNSELVHYHLVKQLGGPIRQHGNQLKLNYLIFNVIFNIIDNFMIFSL